MRHAAAIAVCLASQGFAQSTWTTELFVSGLARPVSVKSPPGDMDRIFIVEQRSGSTGRVRIYKNSTGALNTQNFVVVNGVSTGSEQGLLDIAFHPDFADNGIFYMHHNQASLGGDTVIAEYGLFAEDVANPTPIRTLFVENQPFSNHNGGWMDFGPDGYLYISLGDGGSAGDPGNRAQDITSQMLGKMLRLDVDGDDFPGDPDRNYAIPA
ncbi:MAG: PQQ-dependent sugar dehydrogenase, partial [Phycisphaerales bacterium]|nr:PQQ-dependent sugar dehydrogenase [Phycisphaerales bacterium]